MKIYGANNINNIINKQNTGLKSDFDPNKLLSDTEVLEKLEALIGKLEIGAIYEGSILEDKGSAYDLISIKNLIAKSEDVYGQVVKIVEEALSDQGKIFELINRADTADLEASILFEAKEMISPKGRLGVESVSERIVEYVKLAAEGEVKKVEVLITAIDKAVKDIELALNKTIEGPKMLENLEGKEKSLKEIANRLERVLKNAGENPEKNISIQGHKSNKESAKLPILSPKDLAKLPVITQKTYERIIEKLEDFISIERLVKNPENVKVQLKEMLETMVTKQLATLELIKQLEVRKGDPEQILRLKEILQFDGRLGAAYMSNRLVKFVKLAGENDTEKLDGLNKALEEAFKELEKAFKNLPDLSKKTFDLIMKKLKDWEEELEDLKKPSQKILIQIKRYLKVLKETELFGIAAYKLVAGGWFIAYYISKVLFK